MKLPSLDLRAKIFLGGALLLVPLAITLAFLTADYRGQIATAQKEELGRQVTDPLVNVLIAWTVGGPAAPANKTVSDNLDLYLSLSKGREALLGKPWDGAESPEAALRAGAGGDSILFGEVTRALLTELGRVTDGTGLVLDPDLDSYYAILPIYQGLPEILDNLVRIDSVAQTNPGSLSARGRINLALAADNLNTSSTEVQDWLDQSFKAVSQGYVPVPGYEDRARPLGDDLAVTAAAIRRPALAMAEGSEPWNPDPLTPKFQAMLQGLGNLHDAVSPALGVMLGGRISALTGRLWLSWGSALAGLLLASAAFLGLGNGIRRRSAVLVDCLERLAEGDLTRPVDRKAAAGGDELARLGRAVSQVRDDMAAAVGAIRQVNEKLAVLGSGLAATAEESASAIEEMSASAAQVSKLADRQQAETDEASGNVQALVDRIAESNELTQGMASQFFLFSQAMEANRRRIQETSTEAQETGRLAEDLDRTGETGQQSLEALRVSIGSVAHQTQEIQEIVRFILDIADRTNLLSMNAGIEAAHAGNQGRGFKVVADEIRKLAETSGVQAQNIRALVEGIAGAADTTLQRSEATGAAFHRLREDIAAAKTAAQAIAAQIAHQEAEDTKLTAGLEEFTRFYSDLSGSMDIETSQSEAIRQVMTTLADSGRQISLSTAEQRVGMGQATDAVIQMRDTSTEVARILDELNELLGRFRT